MAAKLWVLKVHPGLELNPDILRQRVTDSYGNVSVSDSIIFFTSTPSPPSATITSPTNSGDSPYSLGDIITIDILMIL